MDELFLFLRVAVALAAVLGLIWFVGRRFHRTGGGSGEKLIRVVDRQGLAAKAAVAVVDVEGRRYVLGVSEQSVSLLSAYSAEVGPQEEAAEATAEEPQEQPAEPAEAQPEPAVLVPDFRTELQEQSRLHGTIFARSTWRQAAEAVRRGRRR